jgi:hypothetical protein
LFFAVYICLTMYMFLSLVLAVVYNLYQRVAAAQITRRASKAQRSVWKAYVVVSVRTCACRVYSRACVYARLARHHPFNA